MQISTYRDSVCWAGSFLSSETSVAGSSLSNFLVFKQITVWLPRKIEAKACCYCLYQNFGHEQGETWKESEATGKICFAVCMKKQRMQRIFPKIQHHRHMRINLNWLDSSIFNSMGLFFLHNFHIIFGNMIFLHSFSSSEHPSLFISFDFFNPNTKNELWGVDDEKKCVEITSRCSSVLEVLLITIPCR